MNTIKISEFFATDYVDQASYNNLRMIASLVDGQKNTSRKILYTVLEKNIKEKIKVSQLNSKVAEFTEYLHGDMSGVISNMGASYTGSNNIPLLQKKGNFGTRFSPEASAPRYIYAYGSKDFFNLFNKEDTPILKHQTFEGEKIEPRFYVPMLPILLINGSEGVSSGFAQKILPRNPKNIKNYIIEYLENGSVRPKKSNSLEPYYEGFIGDISSGESSRQWIISGIVERKTINKVLIKELPIGYSLKSYRKILDDLEKENVIQSFKDLSDNDNFKFEVTILSKDLKSWDDETLYSKLKLVKKVSENYTVINEDNKIEEFGNIKDILDKYISIRMEYMDKRKTYLIDFKEQDIRFDYSKYLFIKGIVEDKIIVNKKKKSEVEKQLENFEHIIQRDGSYDYLLNMAISSLTEERMNKLEEDIKTKKLELDKYKQTSVQELWLNEIKDI